MYNWMELDANEITNLYLYGATTKPNDLSSEALIRSTTNVTTISMDATSFMVNGPGRFANGANSPLVAAFMAGTVLHTTGSRQVFTRDQAQALTGLAFKVELQQYNYADSQDDHALRTYVYGSSSFAIASDALFVVEADGTRHIENYAVLPYNDDFDFESSNGLTQFGNKNYLEPRIDPSGIGRKVVIVFDQDSKNKIPHIDYTQANYSQDFQRSFDTFNPIAGVVSLALEMPAVVDGLWASGTTRFLDQSGRAIFYGTNGDDTLAPANFDNVALISSLRTGMNAKGVAFVAGDGDDTLTGGIRNDALYGGAGNDTYIFKASTSSTIDTITDADGLGSIKVIAADGSETTLAGC